MFCALGDDGTLLITSDHISAHPVMYTRSDCRIWIGLGQQATDNHFVTSRHRQSGRFANGWPVIASVCDRLLTLIISGLGAITRARARNHGDQGYESDLCTASLHPR